jgi:hypothetical protein
MESDIAEKHVNTATNYGYYNKGVGYEVRSIEWNATRAPSQ